MVAPDESPSFFSFTLLPTLLNQKLFDYLFIANHQIHALTVIHYVKQCIGVIIEKTTVQQDIKLYGKIKEKRKRDALNVAVNYKNVVQT
jgi:hypothetical protein